ncbi:hypothetical protein DSO57_1033307 [Entomophthora muscae]|uniref:Uncharacterized protein n=1 Tax=Entomophthora muscae TaxID=34485 RepID=A0ACC2T059_9FUNG|nr:hypothetical protein DSO57_1033307 [Entomophthora muscae]
MLSDPNLIPRRSLSAVTTFKYGFQRSLNSPKTSLTSESRQSDGEPMNYIGIERIHPPFLRSVGLLTRTLLNAKVGLPWRHAKLGESHHCFNDGHTLHPHQPTCMHEIKPNQHSSPTDSISPPNYHGVNPIFKVTRQRNYSAGSE